MSTTALVLGVAAKVLDVVLKSKEMKDAENLKAKRNSAKRNPLNYLRNFGRVSVIKSSSESNDRMRSD